MAALVMAFQNMHVAERRLGFRTEQLFVESLEPLLGRGELTAAMAQLRESWPDEALRRMLRSGKEPVIHCAVSCLGLSGDFSHTALVAGLLCHRTDRIAACAQDALWSIWMRASTAAAARALTRAVRYIEKDDMHKALRVLDRIVAVAPEFAEAQHQRAIALHCLPRLDQACEAYRCAAALNPWHYAALAGMGHAHAQLGEFGLALAAYRRALEINPRLDELREVIPRLQAHLDRDAG